MNKIKNLLFLLSSVIFVACGGSDDNKKDDNDYKLADVVFNIDLSDKNFVNQDTINTHANGAGKNIDILRVECYAIDGSYHVTKEFAVDADEFEVTIPLEQGRVYNVIFWAQNSECEVYDLSNINMIRMKNPEIASHQGIEKMDAFYGVCKKIEITEVGLSFDVKMMRPFAQINVGTTGVWKENSIKLLNVPTAFSPIENRIVARGDLEFKCAVMPDKIASFLVNNAEYQYVGLIYVFAPQAGMSVNGLMTVFNGKEEITYTLSDVDIQVNRKTVVLGDYTN